MRRICGSLNLPRPRAGRPAATSSQPPRKPCAEFWVDAARRKRTEKHGGGRRRVDLPDVAAEPELADEKLVALDAALTRLAAEDPLAARVVELRHFAGLSIEDAAAALGLSRATAYRHWTYARAWLRDAISEAESG